MKREIQSMQSLATLLKPVENPRADWEEQVRSGKFHYLLAHALDGVIWGRVDGGALALSGEAFPEVSPGLCEETLLELRLFGPQAEWFLWRTDQGWQARTIVDGQGDDVEYYDESSILWGTDVVDRSKPPFFLVAEADTGIRHAPPMELHKRHTLRLRIRHYLAYDVETGAVFVKLSRLVDLEKRLNVKNGGEQ